MHDFVQHFRRQRLHHGYLARAGFSGFDEFGGVIGKLARGGCLGREHRKLEPNRLLIPERSAEGLTAPHVVRGQFDCLGGFAGADTTDADALVLEGFHDAVKAAVLLAEQIFTCMSNFLTAALDRVMERPSVILELLDCYNTQYTVS